MICYENKKILNLNKDKFSYKGQRNLKFYVQTEEGKGQLFYQSKKNLNQIYNKSFKWNIPS